MYEIIWTHGEEGHLRCLSARAFAQKEKTTLIQIYNYILLLANCLHSSIYMYIWAILRSWYKYRMYYYCWSTQLSAKHRKNINQMLTNVNWAFFAHTNQKPWPMMDPSICITINLIYLFNVIASALRCIHCFNFNLQTNSSEKCEKPN